MNTCNIMIDGVTECNTKADHNLILDDQQFRLCKNCFSKIKRSVNLSSSPENVKVRVFTNRVWTDDEIAMLGSFKDSYVAKQLCISVSAVSSKRRELGIPFLKIEKSRERVWSKKEKGMLGTLPDRELAKLLGISTTTVGNKRRQLNIKPFDRPTK